MFFSVITKNSNWEILTKNLVTFERSDAVKDEKPWHFGGSLKNLTFIGRFTKNQYRGEDCLKRGAWTVCKTSGGLTRKRGWCFRGGWYANAHYV